jgi:hypothetical protein
MTLDPDHPDAQELTDDAEDGTAFATCEGCETTYAIL